MAGTCLAIPSLVNLKAHRVVRKFSSPYKRTQSRTDQFVFPKAQWKVSGGPRKDCAKLPLYIPQEEKLLCPLPQLWGCTLQQHVPNLPGTSAELGLNWTLQSCDWCHQGKAWLERSLPAVGEMLIHASLSLLTHPALVITAQLEAKPVRRLSPLLLQCPQGLWLLCHPIKAEEGLGHPWPTTFTLYPPTHRTLERHRQLYLSWALTEELQQS